MQTPKVLAIDYGTVRVGTAVSVATLADPLEIIPNSPQLFERIVQICTDHDIEHIVVGLSENEMAEKTREFVSRLKQHVSVPVELIDETLSSYAVHQKLKTAKKSKRSGNIDHYAAAEFLQAWLDERY